MNIGTLRADLKTELADMNLGCNVQVFTSAAPHRKGEAKPAEYASIKVVVQRQAKITVLELAFGRVDGQPAARLFLRDQGRVGAGYEVSPSTLRDVVDMLSGGLRPAAPTPPMPEPPKGPSREEAALGRLRVECAFKGWGLCVEGDSVRISRPSPDGPSAPDVVVIPMAELARAAVSIRSVSGAYLVRACPIQGLVSGVFVALEAAARLAEAARTSVGALDVEAEDVKRAGIDPGPFVSFRVVPTSSGLDLEGHYGDGAWGLHPASTLWPLRVAEVAAARAKNVGA